MDDGTIDRSEPPTDVAVILADHQKVGPLYRELADRSATLITQILADRRLRVHSVSWREKSTDQSRAKLLRPDKLYHRLGDVTDLAGVRVITHMADDVDAIGRVIEREFSVVKEHSIDNAPTPRS